MKRPRRSPDECAMKRPRIRSPELNDDAIGEILFRIPPDESAHLVRASMVCKLWRRIVTDPHFTRRYRELHRRTPPLLGFLHVTDDDGCQFFPTMAPCPFPQPQPELDCSIWFALDDPELLAIDCRHGRVLLQHDDTEDLFVWDPITGAREQLPAPNVPYMSYAAMVLCAAAGAGCDHRHCHGGPFLVVFVGSYEGTVEDSVYSSKTHSWGTPASVDLGSYGYRFAPKRGVLIGDHTYFTLCKPYRILKYDLGKNLLSAFKLPLDIHNWVDPSILPMEDGSLGFADVRFEKIYLWQRKVDPNGVGRWVPRGVIMLYKLVKIVSGDETAVIGFAEGVGVMFVRVNANIFMLELKTRQVRKVGEFGYYYDALPFMSFYTPGSASSILPLPAEKTEQGLSPTMEVPGQLTNPSS